MPYKNSIQPTIPDSMPEPSAYVRACLERLQSPKESSNPRQKGRAEQKFAQSALQCTSGIWSFFEAFDSIIQETDKSQQGHLGDLRDASIEKIREQIPKLKDVDLERVDAEAENAFRILCENDIGLMRTQLATQILGGLFDTYSTPDQNIREPKNLRRIANLGYRLVHEALGFSEEIKAAHRKKGNKAASNISIDPMEVLISLLNGELPITQNPNIYWQFFRADHWVFDAIDDFDRAILPKGLLILFVRSTVAFWYGKTPQTMPIDFDKKSKDILRSMDTLATHRLDLAAVSRLQTLVNLFQHNEEEPFIVIDDKLQAAFPFNTLFEDPHEMYVRLVHHLAQERTTSETDELTIVYLPHSHPRIVPNKHYLGEVALEIRHKFNTGIKPVTDPSQIRTFLEYMGPSFETSTLEWRDNVLEQRLVERQEALEKVKTALTQNPQRALPSKRVLEISFEEGYDEELAATGITKVEFEKINHSESIVRVYIGEGHVVLHLKDWKVVEAESRNSIFREPVRANFLTALWWETKLLRILSGYINREVREDEDADLEHVQRGKVINRAGHRRLLPAGQRPSQEQKNLAQEQNGWNVDEWNAGKKNDDPDERFYTYVTEIAENESSSEIPSLKYKLVKKGE